jgi:pyrimidine-specific ribonucleoside hydrolase
VSAGHNVEDWGPVHAIPTYHKAGAGERTAPFGTADHPIPLIVDSDPGLDDALAIGLAAASPEINLLAVTTVGGNADVTVCTENALRLLHAYGRDDVPVAEGAAGALLGTIVRATEVHGASGIGESKLDPSPNEARPEGAVELMARLIEASPEPVAIAPIGPLTNIALLLRLHPQLASRISHLCLMGGSIGEGNTTASAEFNIIADPEAADVVFRSGVPITMIGLDVTHQARLTLADADRMEAKGNRTGRIFADLMRFFARFHEERYGWDGSPIHDAVAVAHTLELGMVQTRPYRVDIETQSELTRGRTVVDLHGLSGKPANADVGIGIDRPAFINLLLESVAQFP